MKKTVSKKTDRIAVMAHELRKKGIQDELTLTSKISEDVFAMVAKEFG